MDGWTIGFSFYIGRQLRLKLLCVGVYIRSLWVQAVRVDWVGLASVNPLPPTKRQTSKQAKQE